MMDTSQEYARIDYANLWLPYLGPFTRKMHFSMPKGCVTHMDEMFCEMAVDMNGLDTGRKLKGKKEAHGTKSVFYAS